MHEKIIILSVGLVIGFVLRWLFRTRCDSFHEKYLRKFFIKATLIKSYWLITGALFVATTASCAVILYFSPPDKLAIYINIWTLYVAFFVAVFGGYYAFTQVIENRFDKYYDKAKRYGQKSKNLKSAYEYYKRAFKINHKDIYCTINYLEVLALLKKEIEYNEVRVVGEENCTGSDYEIALLLTDLVLSMMKENYGTVREITSSIIEFCLTNKPVHEKFSWSFSEIEESDNYKKLDADLQRKFLNLKLYLEKNMDPADINRFENGDYDLTDENEEKIE